MSDTILTAFSNIVSGIRIRDIIDIAIVAFAIYKVLGFIRETRAAQLVKGLLFLALATVLSGLFDLYTINYILVAVMKIGAIALVILFQPEMRRGLEFIGRSPLMGNPFRIAEKSEAKQIIAEICEAIDEFSDTRTGSLIILERAVSLENISETGTMIEADVTTQLLGTIFYEGTPLHDGAVVIKGNKVHAAGCILPLSHSREISTDLGTRHRAGMGITENSDAIAIIVSEETGIISVAKDGKLSRFLDSKALEKLLLAEYLSDEEEYNAGIPFLGNLRRNKREHE